VFLPSLWFVGAPAARVARGVAWLDENAPGWVLKVNELVLDLDSNGNCVLGQVYGSFRDAPPMRDRSSRRAAAWAARHGFVAIGGDDSMGRMDMLRLELKWAKTVRLRRGAEVLAS
jgi:hypothetical protein